MAQTKFLDLIGLAQVINWAKGTFVGYNSKTSQLTQGGGNINEIILNKITKGNLTRSGSITVKNDDIQVKISNDIRLIYNDDQLRITPRGITAYGNLNQNLCYTTDGGSFDLTTKADKTDLNNKLNSSDSITIEEITALF